MLDQLFLWDADAGGAGAGGGEPPAGDGQQGGGDPPGSDNKDQPGPVPYDRFKQINSEAKSLRAELDKLKAAETARQKKQAEDEGKWKDLYEQREKELAEERATRLRLEVAHQMGIPSELVNRLQGSTPEELQKDAENLLSHLKPSSGPGMPPAGNGSGPTPLDMSKMSPEEIRKNRDKLWKKNVRGQ